MNIQIYGRKKCFDTRKTERYFKERKIKFQSIDIDRYGLSRGEIASVRAAVGIDSLLDTSGKEYGRLNLKYISTGETKEEMLLNNPKLFVSPIVRNGKQATVGYRPEIWKDWKWSLSACVCKRRPCGFLRPQGRFYVWARFNPAAGKEFRPHCHFIGRFCIANGRNDPSF